MRLILHVFWKDLRRLRWLLLLWYAFIALESLILSSGYDISMVAATILVFDKLVPVLEIVAFLTLLLIVSRLIHEDSLVGTTSFWLTRPISHWTLLAAKFLFVFVVLFLPMVVADAFVLLSNGITMGDTAICLAETMLRDELFLLLVMLTAAVLTPNLPRMIVVGVLLLALSMVLWYAGMFISIRFGVWPRPMNLRTSSVVVQSIVAIVLCSAVAVHQFGTRRTLRSATGLYSGVVFFTMVSMFWPIDLFPEREIAVEPSAFNPSDVEVSLADSPLVTPFRYKMIPGQPGFVSGALVFSNVEQGFLVRPVSVRSSLTFEDGATLNHQPNDYIDQFSYGQLSKSERDWLQKQIERTLGGVQILNPEDVSGYSYRPKLVTLDESQYQKYRHVPGVFSAEVKAMVSELRVEAEIPIQVGAGHSRGSFHFSVIGISPQAGGMAITIRYSYPGSMFVERQLDWDHIVLLNRNENQAVTGKFQGRGWDNPSFPVPFTGSSVMITHWAFVFATPNESDQRIDDPWLSDAKLVLIDEFELGTFEKAFEVRDFVMEE